MSWTDIPDAWLDAETEIRDDIDGGGNSVFQLMDDNQTAWNQGTTGAPKLTGAAWDDNNFNADRFAAASFAGPPTYDSLFEPGSITQSRLASSSVGQAELKTSSAELTEQGPSGPGVMALNAAGAQTLGYESRWMQTGPTGAEYYRFGFPGLHAIQDATTLVVSERSNSIALESWVYLYSSTYPGFALNLNFISASPPWELDGREALLFCYLRQRPDGSIAGSWTSPTPPWAYNGPHSVRPDIRFGGKSYQLEPRGLAGITDIREQLRIRRETRGALQTLRETHRKALEEVRAIEQAHRTTLRAHQAAPEQVRRPRPLPFRARDFQAALAREFREKVERLYDLHELTPARKNLDQHLYPQPWGPNPRASRLGTDRVVLLDPSDRMADDLSTLQQSGASVGELLAGDWLRIGDDLAGAPSPAGIPAVDLRWKDTG